MKTKADMLVHHATVYTVDKDFSRAEAFAVRDHRMVAVGTNSEILNNYDAPLLKDAGNKTIYPGFIDAHAHFYGYGKSLQYAGLNGAKSWDETVQRVKDFSSENPFPWIQGRGWDQNDWEEPQFPDNTLLNNLFSRTPVLLTRVDGHAAIANQAALEAAHIQPHQHIDGGEFQMKEGKLSGILIDNAIDAVAEKIPPLPAEQKEKCLLDAQQNCFAEGITSVHDCGLGKDMIDFIDHLQQTGKLKMRLYIMISDKKENYDHYLKTGPHKTDHLNVCAFKLFSDGALGSRGACMIAPYTDRQGWKGFFLKPEEYFQHIADLLISSGFQMCTHAIGDAANRMMLRVYGNVLKGKNDRRWRIEHAQILHKDDIALFGRYNIIPSVQPTHATSDMYWAEERLGKLRLENAYAYKALLKQNGWIPLGTDFPVEDISPMKTFYAAVTRRDGGGYPENGFEIQHALTREETLRGMTIWAAKAAFEENEKGSIEAGKFADFVMMDRDIMNVPVEEILNAKVLETYVGGEKVF
jgi:predicted amidohydrolase YtcJ